MERCALQWYRKRHCDLLSRLENFSWSRPPGFGSKGHSATSRRALFGQARPE